ncbi:TetR/AcrR family transcriptional regulator [Microbacterium sp.]|uniref:TetR/AcrR family transcriptional regulator n=1 Tax=Microbacterium sp. TaxID=51671 RepID=UPI003C73000E
MAGETDGRRARGRLRRELILRTAVDVIDRRGGGALTHRAVADSGGISLASVTYHFPSARQLSAATYEWAGLRLLDYMANAADWASVTVGAFPELAGQVAAGLALQRRGELITVNHMSLASADDANLHAMSQQFRGRSAGVFDAFVEPGSSPILLAAVNGLLVYALSDRTVPQERIAAAVSALVRKFALPAPPAAGVQSSRNSPPSG